MARTPALLLLVAAACGPATVTVSMQQEANSGESGTATLKDLGGGQTQVVISLAPGTDTGAQPAHIHLGTCPGLGNIFLALNPVTNGAGTSTVAAKLADLQGGKYVINVHNSATSTTYVSCGAIP